MTNVSIPLNGGTAPGGLARFIREARTLIGWTQRELATRCDTSQSTICRVEAGKAGSMDLDVIERILAALGMPASLDVDARHLADRRRQRDALHAPINGGVARRLEPDGWLPAMEVQLGDDAPRGWIDLLAFRPADRSLLIEETKTDLPDMGGLQRSLALYEREAWAAAARLGWRPSRCAVLVVALDSEDVARRLAANRDLIGRAFPSAPEAMAMWLADPAAPAPRGWTLGTFDPATRSHDWLQPTTLGGKRRTPRYVDYADAARRLLR